MKPVLYAAVGSCSICAQVALEETGIPYDINYVKLFTDSPMLNEVNPAGKVPALRMESGEVITQNSVMLPYLADLRPETGLLAPVGTDTRRKTLQWFGFFNSDVQPALRAIHRAGTCASDVSELRQIFERAIAKHFAYIERSLKNSPWLSSDVFSIADIYCGACYAWARRQELPLSSYPTYHRLWAAFEERPAVQRARALEAAAA